MFGYDLRGELEGKAVEILLSEPLREGHKGYRKEYSIHPIAKTMSVRPLLEGKRKDDTTFPVVVSLYPGVAGSLVLRKRIVVAIVFDMSAGMPTQLQSSYQSGQ
jgi:hypothetical protein